MRNDGYKLSSGFKLAATFQTEPLPASQKLLSAVPVQRRQNL